MNIFPKLRTGRWGEVNLNRESLAINLELTDPRVCETWVDRLHHFKGIEYSYGGFLENRATLWKHHYNAKSKAFTHLGIDITVPRYTEVTIPSPAEVVHVMENGDDEGGWGGRILFKLQRSDSYLIYGHLAHNFKVKPGDVCTPGEIVGAVGGIDQNGGWWPHLHIQLMEAAFVQKFKRKQQDIDGYLREGDKDLKHFLDPTELIGL